MLVRPDWIGERPEQRTNDNAGTAFRPLAESSMHPIGLAVERLHDLRVSAGMTLEISCATEVPAECSARRRWN